ncbi:MAG: rhamnan synthesis F family protein [Turneriella sp.]|nr:rhamnan synthesis F family protein [Turneriella sp.]
MLRRYFLLPLFYFLHRVHAERLFSRDPQILKVYGEPQIPQKKLCIFASYTKTAKIPRYIHYALRAIADAGFGIIFVSSAPALPEQEVKKLLRTVRCVVWRRNVGYDFGSWKAGFLLCAQTLKTKKQILFANDSTYFPLYKKNFWRRLPQKGICGMTDSLEPRPHLMSYFLLFGQDVIQSPAFGKFWSNVRMLPRLLKLYVIVCYELGLSDYFRRQGFALHALFSIRELGGELGLPEKTLQRINPLHDLWHYLITEKRCPVLKVDLFRRFFLPNQDGSWRSVIAATDYDLRLIEEHQKELGYGKN